MRERGVELVGVPGRQRGGALLARAAHDDRRARRLDRLRQRRRVDDLVVLAGEAVLLARRRGPQAGDDLQLLLEPVEALAERRERDAVRGVLPLEPAAAQAELDPAAAHRVDLGDARSPAGRAAGTSPR